jgi:hypothetical protein
MGNPAPPTGTGPAGVSLSDLLTVLRNVAQAINQAQQAYSNVQGISNSGSLSATTLIKSGPGRVCTVIVTTAGAAGAIYDSANKTATTNPIFVVPATVGIYVVNVPTRYGIVYAPGAAQVAVVSFS